MLARLSAFVIWALVAATAVFWGLRLFVRAPAMPTYAVAVGDAAAVRGDLTRLLGAAPVTAEAAAQPAEASARFRLTGIVAPRAAPAGRAPSSYGVALIAVDGKMPKAYAVGAHIDGDLVLQSVSLRTASISSGQGAPTVTLELPRLADAATGTLPPSLPGAAPAAVTPVPAMTPQFVPPAMTPQFVPPAMPVPVSPPQAPPGASPPVR
jgi:general secretion pathway protein C